MGPILPQSGTYIGHAVGPFLEPGGPLNDALCDKLRALITRYETVLVLKIIVPGGPGNNLN